MTAFDTSKQRSLRFKGAGEDGFGAYHDLYASGSTASLLGPYFRATLVAYRFPGLLMFDRQSAGVAHLRDHARVRIDGFDHFNIQVLRAGRMVAGAPGEEQVLKAGDAIVFDTSRPQRTAVEEADYVAVSLPRDVVEAALPWARHLHGAVLPRRSAGLLGDMALSLMRHASTLNADLAARSGAMLADLLAAAAGDAGMRRLDDTSDEGLILHRARGEAYIDANLSDPDLDADRIAAALGLSRSGLYRAFAPAGGVGRRITARRLGRLRAALRRPGERRSVASLAFALGFGSESHCSRAFKAAVGVTPVQFRAEARGFHEARQSVRPCGIDDWVGEVC